MIPQWQREAVAAAFTLHARIRPAVDLHRDRQARLARALLRHPEAEDRLMRAYTPALDRYLVALLDSLALFPRFYGQKHN